MIKPEELRLGNLITYKSRADTNEMFDVEVGDLYRILEGPEGYDPILLTSDWLVKMGYIKLNDLDHYYGIEISETARLVHNSKFNFTELEVMGFSSMLKQIKFVHQIQNLYHSLTGKELEIK